MKDSLLLTIAVVLIVIGVTGIAVSTFFDGRSTINGAPSMMGMMMGGGMMDQQHMKEMMKNMMPGILPPGIKPESLPEPNSQGAKLFADYCSQCHDLPSPSMHSEGEWPAIAGRMFARISMMSGKQGMMGIASPSAKEQEIIIDYLKRHSLKSISPDELPSPNSQAAVLFKERCSQCHSLPNPKIHAADEWPGIVERMRSNMKSMGKTVITEDEQKVIAGYLTSHARK